MQKYLFKCTINYTSIWEWNHKGVSKTPVYYIAFSKEEASEYINSVLRDGCTVKSVTKLGKQLSGYMFHGK